MKKFLTVTAVVVAAALLGGPALASKTVQHGSMSVDDKAGAFTADGVKKAQTKFEGVEFKVATHYTVVTHTKDTIPADIRKDLEAADGSKDKASGVLLDFARQVYKSKARAGVLTLVYMDGDRFMVKTVTDRESDKYRNFTDADCSAASNKFADAIRRAKGKDDGKTIRDGGLVSATDFVIDQLKDTTVPENVRRSGTVTKKSGGLSILQWVLIIGGGLLVMWIVIGLIRALTGGGGGGGGGGYGGGGGGGFGSSLLGGMFGAMAGMYLYNSMFGGGMSHASASDGDYGGGDGGNYDTGGGDVDGGAAGGDGDWGDGGGDGAGGDWGDGGGDLGGGDFGGGGDDW